MSQTETATRVQTAIIGGSILLLFLLKGGYFGASLVAAIIGAFICWELSNILFQLPDRHEKQLALVGTAWLILFTNALFPKTGLECLVFAVIGMFIYFLLTSERNVSALQQHFNELVFTIFSLVYTVCFLIFLPLLRGSVNGMKWTILFLIIVWTGDTGAYFVGRKYGKRKLALLISPRKTVEGAIGGLCVSILCALFFKIFFFKSIGFFSTILTAFSVGILSQTGDLCESFFKRSYGLKDTSQILPGHGGMLDRFDGILFSLPLMYLCSKWFE